MAKQEQASTDVRVVFSHAQNLNHQGKKTKPLMLVPAPLASKDSLAQTEDILFTMFEELNDTDNLLPGGYAAADDYFFNESDEDDTETLPALLDYFEPPIQAQAPNASTKEKKKTEEEVKEEVKEPPKKAEAVSTIPAKEEAPKEKEVEPNAEML